MLQRLWHPASCQKGRSICWTCPHVFYGVLRHICKKNSLPYAPLLYSFCLGPCSRKPTTKKHLESIFLSFSLLIVLLSFNARARMLRSYYVLTDIARVIMGALKFVTTEWTIFCIFWGASINLEFCITFTAILQHFFLAFYLSILRRSLSTNSLQKFFSFGYNIS